MKSRDNLLHRRLDPPAGSCIRDGAADLPCGVIPQSGADCSTGTRMTANKMRHGSGGTPRARCPCLRDPSLQSKTPGCQDFGCDFQEQPHRVNVSLVHQGLMMRMVPSFRREAQRLWFMACMRLAILRVSAAQSNFNCSDHWTQGRTTLREGSYAAVVPKRPLAPNGLLP